ncbi:hypothetical protein ABZ499_33020 [Streptomyces sp. NPDC019990]|uniref:hypothetical protein n=1 Tax=Streptomyces sp. NPDC019990 TaxID=3154693 RepID=UPI0033E0B093
MTDHPTLLSLLGEWVTVTHPGDQGRVWHGRLASLMTSPSLVLHLPEGGTEVLPQAFHVTGAAPPPGGPHPDTDAEARPFSALRDAGLLWLINRTALHPRGLALALHLDGDGQAYGWSLVTNADGEPWTFDPTTDTDGYRRAEATITKALNRHPEIARCCVCQSRHVTYENYLGQQFCGECANCDCGQDVCVRTRPDAQPTIGIKTSGRTRPSVLGTTTTSKDTVRTPRPDSTSGRPDVPEWKVCGNRRCLDPRCREGATLTEARERIANAMELPLDLISPPRCDCGQTGPLVGEASNGHHFHLSPQQHEQFMRDRDDSPSRIAWGQCWDRAEALRADLQRAVAAYETLRARVNATSKYVQQQKRTGFPFGGGDNRWRILDNLATWTDDPGPLKLATVTDSETS